MKVQFWNNLFFYECFYWLSNKTSFYSICLEELLEILACHMEREPE